MNSKTTENKIAGKFGSEGNWMRRTVISLVFAAGLAVGPAAGLVVGTKSLDASFREAAAVAIVGIDKSIDRRAGRRICGVAYTAHVETVLKGFNGRSRLFLFGRSEGLKPKQSYLLFFRRAASTEDELKVLESRVVKPLSIEDRVQAIRAISCGGLVPGMIFDPNTAWKVKRDQVFAFAIWSRYDLPAGVRINHQGPFWVLRKSDLIRHFGATARSE